MMVIHGFYVVVSSKTSVAPSCALPLPPGDQAALTRDGMAARAGSIGCIYTHYIYIIYICIYIYVYIHIITSKCILCNITYLINNRITYTYWGLSRLLAIYQVQSSKWKWCHFEAHEPLPADWRIHPAKVQPDSGMNGNLWSRFLKHSDFPYVALPQRVELESFTWHKAHFPIQ
jgi:hypothetical protein